MKEQLSNPPMNYSCPVSEGKCPDIAVGQYYQLGNWCYIARGLTAGSRANFTEANAACQALAPTDHAASLAVIRYQGIQCKSSQLLFTELGHSRKMPEKIR